MKNFRGKAIYNPSGKAGEYSVWACNFHVGCSNGCTYCYCKKGVLASTMGGDNPTLKKCFKDEQHALEVFEKELQANLPELQKHGMFFSFTTDPLLDDHDWLYLDASLLCVDKCVPVKFLTKQAVWVDKFLNIDLPSILKHSPESYKKMVELMAFGFTLTGHDDLEPNADTNFDRLEAMKQLHDVGFKTFASIEPIIDFESSMGAIEQSLGYCDLYKIGLMSGQKVDKQFKNDLVKFVERICLLAKRCGAKVYWKESITKVFGEINSEASVSRDYNIFNNINHDTRNKTVTTIL